MENTNAKKKGKGFLVILAIIAIVVIAIIVKTRPQKIDLEEYVTITYSGYNDYATAYASLDRSSVYNKVQAIYSDKKLNESEQLELLFDVEKCLDAVELELNKESEIGNGDKLTVKISYDNELAKEIGIKFTGKKVTVKVKDLEKVKKINVFDGLEVTFSGTSPYGMVEFTYNGDIESLRGSSFTADKESQLRNGDVIKVTLNLSDEQTLRYGFVAKETEKEFKVKGLAEYVESYEKIDKKYLETLKTEAQDTILAHCAGYNNGFRLDKLTYSGYIYTSIKQDVSSFYGYYNNLYLIYSGMVTNPDNPSADSYVYFPVSYSNIINSDGEYSFTNGKNIMGWSNFNNSYQGTNGYINPVACYKELLSKNVENYNTEVGDGFEKFNGDGLLTDMDDISKAYKDTLAKDAKNIVQNYIDNSYAETTVVKDLKLLGEYLLLAKNPSDNYAANNKYILVYSATVSNTEDKFATTTVYYPVEYDGIVKLTDKDFIYTSARGLLGGSTFPDSWYSTNGYLDGALMFQKLVTVHRADYTYEMTKDLKQFGE